MSKQRILKTSIIGTPNSGKSTLLNKLVGTKISIATRKVQTTRKSIRGVLTEDDTQIIFTDTPGIFKTQKNFEKALVKNAWSSTADIDYHILLIDGLKALSDDSLELIEAIQKKQFKIIFVLNKIDRLKKIQIEEIERLYFEKFAVKNIFKLSALKNNKLKEFQEYLSGFAEEGKWEFSKDQITDTNIREIAEEYTREQLYLHLGDELPYSIRVLTEKWEENGSRINLHQLINVMKSSQKNIVIGKQGAMLKKIGMESRKRIAELVGKKVNLFLHVKIDPKWHDEFINN